MKTILPIEIPLHIRLKAVEGATGCNEFAWYRSGVHELVECLKNSSVAILGGDVLKKANDHFEHTYDNWYSEKMEFEEWSKYAERSRIETLKYISRYPYPEDGSITYVIIFKIS